MASVHVCLVGNPDRKLLVESPQQDIAVRYTLLLFAPKYLKSTIYG